MTRGRTGEGVDDLHPLCLLSRDAGLAERIFPLDELAFERVDADLLPQRIEVTIDLSHAWYNVRLEAIICGPVRERMIEKEREYQVAFHEGEGRGCAEDYPRLHNS